MDSYMQATVGAEERSASWPKGKGHSNLCRNRTVNQSINSAASTIKVECLAPLQSIVSRSL